MELLHTSFDIDVMFIENISTLDLRIFANAYLCHNVKVVDIVEEIDFKYFNKINEEILYLQAYHDLFNEHCVLIIKYTPFHFDSQSFDIYKKIFDFTNVYYSFFVHVSDKVTTDMVPYLEFFIPTFVSNCKNCLTVDCIYPGNKCVFNRPLILSLILLSKAGQLNLFPSYLIGTHYEPIRKFVNAIRRKVFEDFMLYPKAYVFSVKDIDCEELKSNLMFQQCGHAIVQLNGVIVKKFRLSSEQFKFYNPDLTIGLDIKNRDLILLIDY